MTKSKKSNPLSLVEAVQYQFSSENKQDNAISNVKAFTKGYNDLKVAKSTLFVGIHEALGKQPLLVQANGTTQKVESLFDLCTNKSLFTSREDVKEAIGFGCIMTFEDWVRTAKPGLLWKNVKGNGKSKTVSFESKVATPETLRNVILHGLGSGQDSPNKDNRKKIIGQWNSFLSKRYKKFCEEVIESLQNVGIEIPESCKQWLPKEASTRVTKTLVEKLLGNGYAVDSEVFKKALTAPTGEVKESAQYKSVLGCSMGMMAKIIKSAEASYGGEFTEKGLVVVKTAFESIEALLKEYKPKQ